MARVKKGLLGGFSGKVGTVVGYSAMGQDLMRSLPKIRTSPAVGKELLNRQKFKIAHLWLQPLLSFLRIGFQDYQPTYVGFVAAKSYLLKNAFIGKVPNQVIDPSLALVSFGTMSPVEDAQVQIVSCNKLLLKWTGGLSDFDDRSMYVIYAPAIKRAFYETAGPKKQANKATVRLPKYLSGQQVLIYLAFTRDDRKNRSKSQFLGEFSIPSAQ